MEKEFLIVGLGNPGSQYIYNRHNVGFMLLDILNADWRLKWQQQFKSLWAKYILEGRTLYLQKPQTYMNLSGEAVQSLSHYYKIKDLSKILVVHDELDLPLGTVRLKKGGGSAGHNGLKSLSSHLASDQYFRLRIGIGRPEFVKMPVADYVLSNFKESEMKTVENVLLLASQMVLSFMTQGPDKTMTLYHNKVV